MHLVGYGRANHAGLGDDDVLRAIVDETALPPDNEANTDGNRHGEQWARSPDTPCVVPRSCRAHGEAPAG